MKASNNNLFFGYSDTAKIRFKKENCYENPEYPCIYRIITKKLDFIVPKAAVLMAKSHVYIPNKIYIQALINHYKSIKI